MSQINNDGKLFHVDGFSRSIRASDDRASVGVVLIDEILLAVDD